MYTLSRKCRGYFCLGFTNFMLSLFYFILSFIASNNAVLQNSPCYSQKTENFLTTNARNSAYDLYILMIFKSTDILKCLRDVRIFPLYIDETNLPKHYILGEEDSVYISRIPLKAKVGIAIYFIPLEMLCPFNVFLERILLDPLLFFKFHHFKHHCKFMCLPHQLFNEHSRSLIDDPCAWTEHLTEVKLLQAKSMTQEFIQKSLETATFIPIHLNTELAKVLEEIFYTLIKASKRPLPTTNTYKSFVNKLNNRDIRFVSRFHSKYFSIDHWRQYRERKKIVTVYDNKEERRQPLIKSQDSYQIADIHLIVAIVYFIICIFKRMIFANGDTAEEFTDYVIDCIKKAWNESGKAVYCQFLDTIDRSEFSLELAAVIYYFNSKI